MLPTRKEYVSRQQQHSTEGKVETKLARVTSKLRLALAAHATDSTNFLQKEYGQWIVGSQRSLLWVMVTALKFIANEGGGEAPLEGSIPDMTYSTEITWYLNQVFNTGMLTA
ncbi:hypothetical protein Tco_1063566 [Tanacetum coccineum]